MHLIVDTEGKPVLIVPHGPEEYGHGLPIETMVENGVTTVICPVLGRCAHGKLTGSNITVLATNTKTVGEALALFKEGKLLPISEELLAWHDTEKAEGRRGMNKSACHEHGHEHGECGEHVRCCETVSRHDGHGHGCGEGRGHCCRNRGGSQI